MEFKPISEFVIDLSDQEFEYDSFIDKPQPLRVIDIEFVVVERQALLTDLVDIHTRTAMDLYGISKEQVTPEMRRLAKMVNYRNHYGSD